MTAPDPRLEAIQQRLDAAVEFHPAPHRAVVNTAGDRHGVLDAAGSVVTMDPPAAASFYAHAPTDLAYLLAELRKAREALARVEEVHYEGIAYADDVAEGRDEPVPDDYEHHFCQEDGEDWPCTTIAALRAAVAATNGDGEP